MAKNKQAPKSEKYISPWSITPKTVDYYRKSYYKAGSAPPLDFTKLETRTAKKPGQGAPWKSPVELKDLRRELEHGK